MDLRDTDPSNTQISTQIYGGALQLTVSTQYFPNSAWILYRPIHKYRISLVPLLLGILDV